MDTYFIGYDAREHEAAAVCAYSIQHNASRRSRVYMLNHRELRNLGLFDRPWQIDGQGQFHDERDGRPFSTEFSHSRFLAFYLADALGCTGPCAFLDCDFLFLRDPAPMMKAQALSSAPDLSCVKVNRTVEDGSTKMDGMTQSAYDRKLWSALFTFKPSSSLTAMFSPEIVNTATGRELHGFFDYPEADIGTIDPGFHFIPSLDAPGSDADPEEAKAIHYSEFSPWLNPDKAELSPAAFALWHNERDLVLKHASRTGRLLQASSLTDDLTKAGWPGLPESG